MKINPFRRHRPGRRKARRQATAIRAKAQTARQQLADTDAMLSARPGRKSSLCAT
jgi:hypothetical protein